MYFGNEVNDISIDFMYAAAVFYLIAQAWRIIMEKNRKSKTPNIAFTGFSKRDSPRANAEKYVQIRIQNEDLPTSNSKSSFLFGNVVNGWGRIIIGTKNHINPIFNSSSSSFSSSTPDTKFRWEGGYGDEQTVHFVLLYSINLA